MLCSITFSILEVFGLTLNLRKLELLPVRNNRTSDNQIVSPLVLPVVIFKTLLRSFRYDIEHVTNELNL